MNTDLKRKMKEHRITPCLQHNINRICMPFRELMGQIYASSTYSVLVAPGKMPQIIYPPETENAVKEVRAEMVKAVKDYLERTRQTLPAFIS